MNILLTEGDGSASRPLYLVAEQGLDAWLTTQPANVVDWVRACNFKAEKSSVLSLPDARGQLAAAVVGLGGMSGPEELGLYGFAAMPERLPPGDWEFAPDLPTALATLAATGWLLGQYRFDRYRARPGAAGSRRLRVSPETDIRHACRVAAADGLVRDLVNTPASDLGPVALAAAAQAVAQDHGADCRQVVGEALISARLPVIHAVGRAGPEEPRLIDMRWGRADAPRVTLVGKGVCFDTGGLDLKLSQSMALMKKDMGGAATALGLAQMVMAAGLDLRLRLLIPAVENSVSASSYRPGDVLHTRKGLTVEVGNTDAEGRLVLADALALADEEHPELIIDLATLTGAARTALGPELPAVFTADQALAEAVERCSLSESDPSWRMPLWLPYDDDLSSKVADLNNIAPHGMAGAILGALFLRRFVNPGTRWLHADLYAWNPRERPGRPVGGEAQLLRALFRVLQERYPARS